MHGVAAHRAGAVELGVFDHDDARIVHIVVRPYLPDGRFARTGRYRACSGRHTERQLFAKAFDRSRSLLERSHFADELAPLGIVDLRQQRFARHLDEFRIAIERFAVGIGELGAFNDRVDELRAGRIGAVKTETSKQRELLQHHGPLAPEPALADGIAAVFERRRRLDARIPARHVGGSDDAAVALAARVHDLLRAAEFVDRLGNKTARPRFARALDLLDAIAAYAFGLAQDAGIRVGERGV